MTIQIGFDPSDTVTSANRTTMGKGFSLGTLVTDHKGQEWTYVQAGSAIPQYNLVRVLASGTAAPWTSAGITGTAGGIRICRYGPRVSFMWQSKRW